MNGAGAAAIACARLFIAVGVRRENMIFCDSQGVVTTYRTDINEIKREFAPPAASPPSPKPYTTPTYSSAYPRPTC